VSQAPAKLDYEPPPRRPPPISDPNLAPLQVTASGDTVIGNKYVQRMWREMKLDQEEKYHAL